MSRVPDGTRDIEAEDLLIAAWARDGKDDLYRQLRKHFAARRVHVDMMGRVWVSPDLAGPGRWTSSTEIRAFIAKVT